MHLHKSTNRNPDKLKNLQKSGEIYRNPWKSTECAEIYVNQQKSQEIYRNLFDLHKLK